MWPFYHYPGFSWGWMIFGGLIMLLFWGGLLIAVFFIIRAALRSDTRQGPRRNGSPATGSKTPLDILKERYARGEISKAEYEQMREDLRE
jgi:putative membrane protein